MISIAPAEYWLPAFCTVRLTTAPPATVAVMTAFYLVMAWIMYRGGTLGYAWFVTLVCLSIVPAGVALFERARKRRYRCRPATDEVTISSHPTLLFRSFRIVEGHDAASTQTLISHLSRAQAEYIAHLLQHPPVSGSSTHENTVEPIDPAW